MTDRDLAGFGFSTYAFRDEPFSPAQLDRVQAAGFRHIELLGNRPHLDYHDREVQRQIVDWFRSNPTEARSLHLPYSEPTGKTSFRWISALASEERDRQASLDELKRALEITDRIPVSWVVLHLGVPGQQWSPVHMEYAYAAVDMIRKFSGTPILIENLRNEISRPERIREFIRVAELPETGICYDVGHGHLDGLKPVLDGVRSIHLNDNDLSGDAHLWPFGGTIDWPRLAQELVAAEFTGPLVLEGTGRNLEPAVDAARRFRDLLYEARSSQHEFSLKYSLG